MAISEKIFEKPEFIHNLEEKFEPQDRFYYWKYLSIDKFIDLVINKELFFSRLDNFSDPLEGATQVQIQDVTQWLKNPKDPEGYDPNLGDEIRNSFALQRNLRIEEIKKDLSVIQKSAFALCLYRTDEGESQAMWDLYSNNLGVAMKIPEMVFYDFMTQLKLDIDLFPKLFYGNVLYKDFNSFEIHTQLSESKTRYFIKNKSFIHENEFRYVIGSKRYDNAFNGLRIDISKVISSIEFVAHPAMPEHTSKNLRKVLEKFSPDSAFSESKLYVKEKFH